MSPSVIHRAASLTLALLVVLPCPSAGASVDVFRTSRAPIALPEDATHSGAIAGAPETPDQPVFAITFSAAPITGSLAVGSGPQLAPVEFDFEMFETSPLHHRNGPMTRAQWVRAAIRHNKGLTRVEARHVWRHPRLRRSMPIAVHSFQRGVVWANPAVAGTTQGESGGCHVAATAWTYGYFVSPNFPFFVRDPLFRFTLHRTWEYNGWRVFPQSTWHDEHITPFADLRWNFEGITDQQSVYIPVGGSSKATHLDSRTGRFESIQALGGAISDHKRWILAKWHGGWETPGHSAHFCTDND
jgi:hypothetical protein